MRRSWLPIVAFIMSCAPGEVDDPPPDPSVLLDVEQTDEFTLPGLSGEAYVVRTPGGVPHIFASTLEDLGRVEGFTVARDRYFQMDLFRRQGDGTLSEILGDSALETDIEAVHTGSRFVAERVLAQIDDDPELSAFVDAYAEGINAYIEAVKAEDLPPPT